MNKPVREEFSPITVSDSEVMTAKQKRSSLLRNKVNEVSEGHFVIKIHSGTFAKT